MLTFLYVLLVIVSLLLMLVILMQSSKGGGLVGTFGGSNTASAIFGGVGAGDFMTKLTAGLAVGFMVVIIVIGLINKGGAIDQNDFQKELQEELIVPGTQFEAAAPAVLGNPGEVTTASDADGDATPE
jgi:preprotein translocase subunit SecG